MADEQFTTLDKTRIIILFVTRSGIQLLVINTLRQADMRWMGGVSRVWKLVKIAFKLTIVWEIDFKLVQIGNAKERIRWWDYFFLAKLIIEGWKCCKTRGNFCVGVSTC